MNDRAAREERLLCIQTMPRPNNYTRLERRALDCMAFRCPSTSIAGLLQVLDLAGP